MVSNLFLCYGTLKQELFVMMLMKMQLNNHCKFGIDRYLIEIIILRFHLFEYNILRYLLTTIVYIFCLNYRIKLIVRLIHLISKLDELKIATDFEIFFNLL